MSGRGGPEQKIVLQIIDFLRGLPGGYAEKVWSGGTMAKPGRPDIDGCVRGRAIKLEVKVPGQGAKSEPTPLQAKYLRTWAAAGAVSACVHSLDEAKQVLRDAGLYGAD